MTTSKGKSCNRTTSEAAADRFKQEMRIVAKLDHPNLVKGYDGGECEGRLYLAMELLDGETLTDYVKRKGPFTPRRACQICIRAARGLQHAHNARSYHRDIKPANIMLTRVSAIQIPVSDRLHQRTSEFRWPSLAAPSISEIGTSTTKRSNVLTTTKKLGS